MEKFYLTFGVQYGSREAHPRGAHVHGDGYVAITAQDYATARDIAVQLYGIQWSDLYTEENFDASFCPRGPLLNIQVP